MAHLRQRRGLPNRQQYLYGRYVPVGLRIWSASFESFPKQQVIWKFMGWLNDSSHWTSIACSGKRLYDESCYNMKQFVA